MIIEELYHFKLSNEDGASPEYFADQEYGTFLVTFSNIDFV